MSLLINKTFQECVQATKKSLKFICISTSTPVLPILDCASLLINY